eukprot:scaffold1.g5282.t1
MNSDKKGGKKDSTPPDADHWDSKAIRKMAGRWYGGCPSGDSDSDEDTADAMPPPQQLAATAAGSGPGLFGLTLAGFGGGGGCGAGVQMEAAKCRAPMPMAPAPPCAAAPMMCARVMACAPGGAGPAAGQAIGFKTGGAMDAANFRENVTGGHLPAPEDITFEGLIAEYFFDTSASDAPPCTELFAPTYSLALAPDPLAAAAAAGQEAAAPPQRDVYLAVGLDSGITVSISLFSDSAATPKRPGTVAAADLCGIKAGVDALRTVGGTNFQAGLDEAAAQLRAYPPCVDGDPTTTESRIIVLTDAQTNTGEVSEEGLLSRLKAWASEHIHVTLVGVGLDFNTELVEKISKAKGANYFSVHTPGEFKKRLEEEFDFMVAPLVFDLELRIDPSSLKPAPSPSPPGEAPAGDWQVVGGGDGGSAPAAAAAPRGGAGGWRVVHVYGSPETEERRLSGGGSIMRTQACHRLAAAARGEADAPALIRPRIGPSPPHPPQIHSLFPSAKTDEGIKGGMVLLRVAPPLGVAAAAAPPLRLSARYADRAGNCHDSLRAVEVPAAAAAALAETGAYYQSSGVRKAVAMARLVDALQCWLADAWADARGDAASPNDSWQADVVASVGRSAGAPAPAPAPAPATPPPAPRAPCLRPGCPLLPPPRERAGGAAAAAPGRWERASQPLRVGPEARAALAQLVPWLEGEVAALGDDAMKQEVEQLKKLAGHGA